MAADLHDEKSIFFLAIDIVSADDRAEYLNEACGEDSLLRARVEELLRQHEQPQRLLDAAHTADHPPDEAVYDPPGTLIGPYKLREQIGEGGFGVVYVAEQEHPVRRKVALKLIKPGMDTRSVMARFEAERQALALMDHPNVARVLDAGATDSGRPYFVMELVHGIPITEFCNSRQLATPERLALFVDVCGAVQHAHQKGIIHRDLKPSNVLVTLHGDKAIPKVIDFGVSKALGQRLTEKTVYTAYGQMIGTPMYMSPEQAELSGLDVDTRSDVYSLGVLLYELLTGTTPFDEETLNSAGFDELRRIIREDYPPRPSARISTLGAEKLSTISDQHQIDSGKLAVSLKGELDWIVMRAIEKDRGRRYESASALAADVQCFLNDDPVTACPPSRLYQFRKFLRRHKTVVVTTLLVFMSLVAGLVGTAWQARRAMRSEEVASNRLADKERAERERSRQLALARLSEARAVRWSGRQGQRFDSLAALRESADILRSLGELDRHRLELRNEAVACMSLVDIRGIRQWDSKYHLAFDAAYERYARRDPQTGTTTIRSMADDRELMSLTIDIYPNWFSPDGRFVLGYDAIPPQVFKVYDTTTHQTVLEVPLGKNGFVDCSRDGERIAVSRPDRAVTVFELPAGNEQHRLSFDRQPSFLRFHPDGTRMAVAFQDEENSETREVQIWNVDDGQMVTSLLHSTPVLGWETTLDWSANGDLLAVACYESGIHVWDAQTFEQLAVLKGHQDEVARVLFTNRDYLLASWGWDGTLRFWEPRDGRQLLSVAGGFYKDRFSLDDRLLARGPQLWEVAPGRELRAIHGSVSETGSLQFSPDGRLLVCCADADGGVRFWDVASGRSAGRLPIGACDTASFDSAGANLFTNGSSGLYRWPITVDTQRAVIRLGPPEQLSTNVHPQSERGDLSSAGGVVAAVSGPGEAVVVFPNTSAEAIQLVGHEKIASVAIDPAARWVASGAWRHSPGGVMVWNARSGELVRNLFPESREAYVTFTPDGRQLVAGTPNLYQFWQVGTWEPGLRISRRHGDDVRGAITFNRDGSIMAIAKTRYVVQLLDAATGRELATLEPPKPSPVCGLCFSPDDSMLAVANWDDVIHLWDLRSIRQQLREMNLDWEPPLISSVTETVRSLPAMRVEVNLGDLGETELSED